MIGMYNTKVTVELRDLVAADFPIWDFEYDSFYTGEDKAAFEQKVIDHYYLRQIGHETAARWHHQFKTRIREIMPYYKRLYETVQIMDAIDDPFGNVDVTETFTQETKEQGKSQSSANSTEKFSDTPQGNIENLDTHLTNATINNGTTEGESNSTQTVTHTFKKQGNQGVNTYAHDMKEYREILLNIDKMIIDDLADLFLLIY